MKKVLFRFSLFGNIKEFYAHKNNFVREFIYSNPQWGKLKLRDLKPIIIVE